MNDETFRHDPAALVLSTLPPPKEGGGWRRSFFFPDDSDDDRDWSFVGFAPRKTRSLTATYARMGEADWFRTAYDGQRILDEGES
jgi:hypothetical protein